MRPVVDSAGAQCGHLYPFSESTYHASESDQGSVNKLVKSARIIVKHCQDGQTLQAGVQLLASLCGFASGHMTACSRRS